MRILVDVPIEPATLNRLQSSFDYHFDCLSPPAEESRPIDIDRLRETDVLFCAVPPTNFSQMQAVKWIQLASTDYSSLVGLGLPDLGIRATNCRGCFDVPIAEWNIAMMVNLARNVRQMIRNQEAAIWEREAAFQCEIRGKTVGLWGYGGIGRESARLARQLGMRVHVLTRRGVGPRRDVYLVPGTGDPDGQLPHRVFGLGEELNFLRGLDFLIVAMQLTKTTDGLIGERELRALPRTAFVLNPARGRIIQEPALLRALREGWIAGAALDTHYYYPMPADHPLWQFPNVIMTPHISGSSLSPKFVPRLWEIFSINLHRFSRRQRLLNEVTEANLAEG